MRHWRPDPMTEDEAAQAARADEDAREQRWAEFVLDCSRFGHARMARHAAELYAHAKDVGLEGFFTREDEIVSDFKNSEGWSGVFAALARAIKEHEALPDDAEMERRR